MSKSIYTWAGVSTLNGVQGLRFANSAGRKRVLERNGHTDVRLEQMPFAGSTEDGVDFLLGQEWARNLPCVRAAAQEAGFLIEEQQPEVQEAPAE